MALFIFNRQLYDDIDIMYNALRLVKSLYQKNQPICLFLMSDSVDMTRDITIKSGFYDYDLVAMFKELYTYLENDIKATMDILMQWTIEAQKVLTF